MKIKLDAQGVSIIICAAVGDIDPVTNNRIAKKSEIGGACEHISQSLQQEAGYKWYIEIDKIKDFLINYREHGFYNSSIRNIIVASLELEKRIDGSFISSTYTKIDDLAKVLERGYNWLLSNEKAIKESLQGKINQEDKKIKQEFLGFIDQEILTDESYLTDQEASFNTNDLKNKMAHSEVKKCGCC